MAATSKRRHGGMPAIWRPEVFKAAGRDQRKGLAFTPQAMQAPLVSEACKMAMDGKQPEKDVGKLSGIFYEKLLSNSLRRRCAKAFRPRSANRETIQKRVTDARLFILTRLKGCLPHERRHWYGYQLEPTV